MIQITHDRTTDTWAISNVMYRPDGEWCAFQKLCDLDPLIADALKAPVIEYTNVDDQEEE